MSKTKININLNTKKVHMTCSCGTLFLLDGFNTQTACPMCSKEYQSKQYNNSVTIYQEWEEITVHYLYTDEDRGKNLFFNARTIAEFGINKDVLDEIIRQSILEKLQIKDIYFQAARIDDDISSIEVMIEDCETFSEFDTVLKTMFPENLYSSVDALISALKQAKEKGYSELCLYNI